MIRADGLLEQARGLLSMPDLVGVRRERTDAGLVWLLSHPRRCHCGHPERHPLAVDRVPNGTFRDPRRLRQWLWSNRVQFALDPVVAVSRADGRDLVNLLHELCDLVEEV